MPLVKIVQNYSNANSWGEGDIVDVTNPWSLIKEGKVILVDAEGNEIPRSDIVLQCPVCIYIGTDIVDLANHLLGHQKEKEVSVVEEVKPVERPEEKKDDISPEIPKIVEAVKEVPKKAYKDMTKEEQKTWRLENLKKAREVAKAKKEATQKSVEDKSV